MAKKKSVLNLTQITLGAQGVEVKTGVTEHDLGLGKVQEEQEYQIANEGDEDEEETGFEDDGEDELPEELENGIIDDAEAHYLAHPEALLELSVMALRELTVKYGFNAVKQAANLGHAGAQWELKNPGKKHETTPPTETASPTKFPVLCWYDSKSHNKRRYYAGAKGSGGAPKWVYEKAEALLIDNVDHAFLVRKLCWRSGYSKAQLSESSKC